MKNIVLFLSVIATACSLVSCASEQPAPAPQPAPVVHHHHDYKGEAQ